MSARVRHRGPDDGGTWIDAEAGVALVHRRLSIVDLSPAGHQPMMSSNGRYVISYNGEVYNYQALRADLKKKGYTFRGHSDTEIILETICEIGIEATVDRLNGMFAIALWDRRDRTLTLIRDRVGIKPLYWSNSSGVFLFASELKGLHGHPAFSPQIDRSAVAAFLRHNYIPAPRTIYQNVFKLQPGTILTLAWNKRPAIKRYWDAREIACSGLASPLIGTDSELTDELDALLKDAIKMQMLADVPLGSFLSGGIDSSAVTALMQAVSSRPVKTFSIGFEMPEFNEAPHAAAVARHLGTDHTEITVSARQAIDVIPELPEFYDEPFADSSQIPTYLVSAATRRNVTVALSGDGGDELFAGYTRYAFADRTWRRLSLLPIQARRAIAAGLEIRSANQWDHIFAFISSRHRPTQLGEKLHKVAAALRLADGTSLYRRLVTHWEPSDLMERVDEYKGVLWDQTVTRDFPQLIEQMQFQDLVTYLPDDILTKVDRASMAVALEARVPLLDHRVVEFAWRLPRVTKIRHGMTKWLLRQVLYRYVPQALIERPKMGFGIPLAEWLRGPLRNWAEHLLDEKRIREAGLLNASLVRKVWADHLSGNRNEQYLLWDVLMLEAWRDRWSSSSAS
jgi:asparagine synthase (glutamine-hydrolysing)